MSQKSTGVFLNTAVSMHASEFLSVDTSKQTQERREFPPHPLPIGINLHKSVCVRVSIIRFSVYRGERNVGQFPFDEKKKVVVGIS